MSLEDKKDAAKEAYVAARNAWTETRTASSPNGDAALWRAFCDAKRLCMQFGVII